MIYAEEKTILYLEYTITASNKPFSGNFFHHYQKLRPRKNSASITKSLEVVVK